MRALLPPAVALLATLVSPAVAATGSSFDDEAPAVVVAPGARATVMWASWDDDQSGPTLLATVGRWEPSATIARGDIRNVAASFERGSGRPVAAWVDYRYTRRGGPDALLVACG